MLLYIVFSNYGEPDSGIEGIFDNSKMAGALISVLEVQPDNKPFYEFWIKEYTLNKCGWHIE